MTYIVSSGALNSTHYYWAHADGEIKAHCFAFDHVYTVLRFGRRRVVARKFGLWFFFI